MSYFDPDVQIDPKTIKRIRPCPFCGNKPEVMASGEHSAGLMIHCSAGIVNGTAKRSVGTRGAGKMGRSGYCEDIDSDEDERRANLYRGAVAATLRGRCGQAFLKEMLAAMDAMPVKTLIAGELESSGQVCAIGSVGRARGVDMKDLDPEDIETVAATFGVSQALAREVVYMNDEWFEYMKIETPGERFDRMRAWIKNQILGD